MALEKSEAVHSITPKEWNSVVTTVTKLTVMLRDVKNDYLSTGPVYVRSFPLFTFYF